VGGGKLLGQLGKLPSLLEEEGKEKERQQLAVSGEGGESEYLKTPGVKKTGGHSNTHEKND